MEVQKMRKIKSSSVEIEMFGVSKTLKAWSKEYELPYDLVRQRYDDGIQNESLVDPVQCDMLDKDYVHQLWGGKWVDKTKLHENKKHIYTEPARWNKTQKWVYVGKMVIM